MQRPAHPPMTLAKRPFVPPCFFPPADPRIFVDPRGTGFWAPEAWEPPCELLDRKTTYLFRMELPGVDKKTLSIKYANGWLSVRGERPYDERTVHTEFLCGAFNRNIPLPNDCDTSKIKASFKDGLLTVVLPKSTPGWVVVDVK